MIGLDPDEKQKPKEQHSLVLNTFLTSSKTIIEIPTKDYLDSISQINRNRRHLSTMFDDQDNELDIDNLTDFDGIGQNTSPLIDEVVSNKKAC